MRLTEENFPTNHDELLLMLQREGSLSITFYSKNKRSLKRGFDLVEKMESAKGRNRGIMDRIKFYLAGLGLLKLDLFVSPFDKGFDKALLIFTVSWRHILNYDGKDIDGNRSVVTFNARHT